MSSNIKGDDAMREIQNFERWKNVRTAASYLGCSKSTLDRDRCTGLLGIPFTRLGKKILYDTADLDAFLESNKVRYSGEVA